jgi:hypothetical protein
VTGEVALKDGRPEVEEGGGIALVAKRVEDKGSGKLQDLKDEIAFLGPASRDGREGEVFNQGAKQTWHLPIRPQSIARQSSIVSCNLSAQGRGRGNERGPLRLSLLVEEHVSRLVLPQLAFLVREPIVLPAIRLVLEITRIKRRNVGIVESPPAP